MKKFLNEAGWLIICVVFCLGVIALCVALVALAHHGLLLDGSNPRFDGGQ